MIVSSSSRLLSIGEFASATQLTLKALRLYDEQDLLRPASTDRVTGYRYYRSAQVPAGRLIRTLREMDLSLSQITEVITVRGAQSEALLVRFAQDIDRRYAREKRAFQTALALMRAPVSTHMPMIEETERDALTVAVWPFLADRTQFVERFSAELRCALEELRKAGLNAAGENLCALIDPPSGEEGRLELLVPVFLQAAIPQGITARLLPASPCAVVTTPGTAIHATEFTATLDALFDWFDRHGRRAVDCPMVAQGTAETGFFRRILWAYECEVVMFATTTCESIYAQLGLQDAPLLIDARSAADFERSARMIPGALRGDPDRVGQWARRLPRDRALAVYCSRGEEVSHSVANSLIALAFPVSVIFSHRGARCSFDAFLDEFDLHDPVIERLADIVRAADTGELALSREAPGLLAISLGLSATVKDDILLLEQAMPIYDALYAWCKTAREETHSWPQKAAAPVAS